MLSPVVGSMKDVIVMRYGAQKKQLSTSAVATVKGRQLTAVPAANISNSLAGIGHLYTMTRANGGRPCADECIPTC